MSPSANNLFAKVRQLVPPMKESFHKGQLGRVAVIGGSLDYTGAPYFSAMASARLGCDMSHVICQPSAAATIKSYSPNLMVHPYLHSSETLGPVESSSVPSPDVPTLAAPIISFISRIHVLVIGPGLGRDPITQKIVAEVMRRAKESKTAMVLDADALILVQDDPSLVHGYEECILTPNVVEFSRLAKALQVDVSDPRDTSVCERLSAALGGVTIIQKGPSDVISNGITSIICDVTGGRKRSGGQGDTLTGSLGTFLAWRKAYHEGLWDDKEASSSQLTGKPATKETISRELEDTAPNTKKFSPATTLLLAAFAGSGITRACSRRAFKAKGRSMQAGDLTDEVHGSFLSLIGEPEEQ